MHNSTLEEIETKFKREFSDIKDNIKRIKQYQRDQEGIVRERALRQQSEMRQFEKQNYSQQIREQREEKKEQLDRLYPKEGEDLDSFGGDSVGM